MWLVLILCPGIYTIADNLLNFLNVLGFCRFFFYFSCFQTDIGFFIHPCMSLQISGSKSSIAIQDFRTHHQVVLIQCEQTKDAEQHWYGL